MSTSKDFGSKAKKMWKSKVSAKAGNSHGKGEWRSFRKQKVASTPKKAPKKERR